jgi:hypothetical protein
MLYPFYTLFSFVVGLYPVNPSDFFFIIFLKNVYQHVTQPPNVGMPLAIDGLYGIQSFHPSSLAAETV